MSKLMDGWQPLFEESCAKLLDTDEVLDNSSEAELLEIACQRGWIEKNGSWFAMGGERMGQGREKALEWLRERPAVTDDLIARIGGGAAIREEPAALECA